MIVYNKVAIKVYSGTVYSGERRRRYLIEG